MCMAQVQRTFSSTDWCCHLAGKVHKSRMQAKNGDTWETWRYLEAGVMVVKSIFTDSRGRSATLLCTDYSVAAITGNL
jgi:hypothetical protein